MPEPTTPIRLAVLIDADNTSAKHASVLLEEVARYGVPTVKRAYGDWTTQNLVGWKDELNRHAITPVQQFSYTTGKNSTDSAMIIDTMDLLYTGNLDAYAIVSSDSDFTRLVTRLRESGKTVYGLGRRRTPAALVAACDKFIFLEVIARGDSSTPEDQGGAAAGAEEEPGGDAAPLPDLDTILVAAVEATSGDDNWSRLDAVGSYLSTRHASFDPRNYGYSKLGAMVRAQDVVEVEERTGQPHVRLRAPATETPTETPTAPATRPRRTRKSAASGAGGSGGGSGRASGKGAGGA